jgi:hypothetical protein
VPTACRQRSMPAMIGTWLSQAATHIVTAYQWGTCILRHFAGEHKAYRG